MPHKKPGRTSNNSKKKAATLAAKAIQAERHLPHDPADAGLQGQKDDGASIDIGLGRTDALMPNSMMGDTVSQKGGQDDGSAKICFSDLEAAPFAEVPKAAEVPAASPETKDLGRKHLEPQEIENTQLTVNTTFSCGASVMAAMAALVDGRQQVQDFPLIRVAWNEKGQKWYSADNRRLFIYKVVAPLIHLQHVEVAVINWTSEFDCKTNQTAMQGKLWATHEKSVEQVRSQLLEALDSGDDLGRCAEPLPKSAGPEEEARSLSRIFPAMAQKISCRPLKGDMFEVEVDAEASVADLKTKISEKHPEVAADLQKLIHTGKILDDKSAVKDVGIKEGEFVVVMVAKAKPPAAPAAAPAAPTPAPAPTGGAAAPGVDTGATAAATVVSGAAAEETVTQLMEMGFERAQVARCLQAAFGNPDRAAEYLMSGIPPGLMADEGTAPPEGGADAPPASGGGGMAPSPAMTGAFPAMPPGGGATGGGGGANVAALERLRNHPCFGELAQAVAADSEELPQILMALEQRHPGLVQVIRENLQVFLRLVAVYCCSNFHYRLFHMPF